MTSVARRAGVDELLLKTGLSEAKVLIGTVDPSVAGVAAPLASVFLRAGTGEVWLKAGAANTAWQFVGPTHYQSAENPARLTTTSPIFQTHVALTTPALTGTFRVAGYAYVDSDTDVQARLRNLTDGVDVGTLAELTVGSVDDRVPVAIAGEVVFAGASKDFELQFRDSPPAGGGVSGMTESRIELWRVI